VVMDRLRGACYGWFDDVGFAAAAAAAVLDAVAAVVPRAAAASGESCRLLGAGLNKWVA
jgi:hypothetical protein